MDLRGGDGGAGVGVEDAVDPDAEVVLAGLDVLFKEHHLRLGEHAVKNGVANKYSVKGGNGEMEILFKHGEDRAFSKDRRAASIF